MSITTYVHFFVIVDLSATNQVHNDNDENDKEMLYLLTIVIPVTAAIIMVLVVIVTIKLIKRKHSWPVHSSDNLTDKAFCPTPCQNIAPKSYK